MCLVSGRTQFLVTDDYSGVIYYVYRKFQA